MDFALLELRLVTGGLLAGHGSQKLLGWFGGPGLKGTSAWLESIGLRPGRPWASVAGGSEMGGGLLTALGLLHPIGPLGILGAMGMATCKVHWGKPIWNASGGAELPLTYTSIATALLFTGPGKYSLDELLGITLPRWIAIPGAAAVAAGIYLGVKEDLVPQLTAAIKGTQGTQGTPREETAKAG